MALKSAAEIFTEADGDIFQDQGTDADGEPNAVLTPVGTLAQYPIHVIDHVNSDESLLIDSVVPQTQTVIGLLLSEMPSGSPAEGDVIEIGALSYEIDNPKFFDDGIEVRVVVVPLP